MKKIFTAAKSHGEMQFTEVTQVITANDTYQIAVSLQVGDIIADIHSGADSATVEHVLHILKSC